MERYEQLEKLSVKERLESFRAEPVSSGDSLEKCGIFQRMELLCMQIQADFCNRIEELEVGRTFKVDKWSRSEHGGGGITCVLQDGEVFEKSGIGVSVVHGSLKPQMQTMMRSRGHILTSSGEDENLPFSVVGVSCVTHPTSPYCPTLHFNYRYFEVQTANGVEAWFGGGTDLTPAYIIESDIKHFHTKQKEACDRSGPNVYSKFKEWCDKYFVVPHRGPSGECRGVGGIFYDDVTGDFSESGKSDYEAAYRHQMSCGSTICDSYFPIIQKRMETSYTKSEKEWQQIRRGRYVEFNLVYDRGTKFGFNTPGARIEAILMSLPLNARWEYENHPEEGSPEHQALMIFQNPREWI